MAAVKSLQDGHTKVTTLPSAPSDKAAITAAEIAAGTDVSSKILASTWELGPTGSSTIDEKPLSATGNFQSFDASNYAGGADVFRYYDDSDGQPDATGDAVYQAWKTKGTTLYIVVRKSYKLSTAAWAAGDEYDYFEVITDDPMDDTSNSGYIKSRINFAVSDASLDKVIVA